MGNPLDSVGTADRLIQAWRNGVDTETMRKLLLQALEAAEQRGRENGVRDASYDQDPYRAWFEMGADIEKVDKSE